MRDFDLQSVAGFELLKPKNLRPADDPLALGCTHVQEKIDGHRLVVGVRPRALGYRSVALTSTGIDVSSQLEHLAVWAHLMRAPDNTWLDCELYSPECPASDVKHQLAQGGDKLRVVCHSVPVIRGKTHFELELSHVEEWCVSMGVPFVRQRSLQHLPVMSRETWLGDARRQSLEGYVFKSANYGGWWKLKVEDTVDAVVTGFVDGNGKHLGLVGSLRASVWHGSTLVEIARVGGMTDDERLEIDEKLDRGRVVEVKYQRVDAGGRLRHPRFVRWRDDKLGIECSSSQSVELWRALNRRLADV